MTTGWMRERTNSLVVAVATIAVDQLTKWMVISQLGPDRKRHGVDVIGSFLAVQYVENTGAAFGVMQGRSSLLTILAIVVLAIVLVAFYRSGSRSGMADISFGLLVGGAVGNLIDRVRFGFVVDFISVGVWPTFNVADSAVTVGVVLLVWHGVADATPAEDVKAQPKRVPLQGADVDDVVHQPRADQT